MKPNATGKWYVDKDSWGQTIVVDPQGKFEVFGRDQKHVTKHIRNFISSQLPQPEYCNEHGKVRPCLQCANNELLDNQL